MANSFTRKVRTALVAILYSLAVIVGIRTALSREREPVDVLLSMSVAAATTLACVTDARVLGRPIIHSVQFIMLLTWPLSPLAYMVVARRWKGLLWFSIHAVLLVGTYWACYFFTALVLYKHALTICEFPRHPPA